MVMAILSDKDIIEEMMNGHISITNYAKNDLTPNGYDLRIAEISVIGDPKIKKEGTVSIPPKSMFYVSTIEHIYIADDLCAQLWLKTTWIRKGVIGVFGMIDAGFNGTLTLGAYNVTDIPINISIGERFCQIVIETLKSKALRNYSQRSGNYQYQSGITLNPKIDKSK